MLTCKTSPAEVAECKGWTEEALTALYLSDTVQRLPLADPQP